MPVDQLRTDASPASKNKILGATYNRLAAMANAPVNGYPILPGTTGPGMSGINVGGGMTFMPAQMTAVGVAIITSQEDTCPEDTEEQDLKWAPCRSSKKYLAKWRRWDATAGNWVTTDEDEYAVDLAMWWPDEDESMTTGPIFLLGDVFSGWLDPMRGMIVPLTFPTVIPVILTAQLEAGATAAAAVLKRTSGGVWQKVTGITIAVTDLSNEADGPWEIGVKGLAVWHGREWIFVPLSCEPDDTGIV